MFELSARKSVVSLMPGILLALAIMTSRASRATLLGAPQGRWIQEECVETWEEGRPPTYSKGVMRFGAENTVFVSSHTFDDSDCTKPRPVSDQELAVPFSLPTFESTDGSVALDLKWPSEYAHSQSFALAKVRDGRLYFGLFESAAARPKAIPGIDRGTTVFISLERPVFLGLWL